MDFGLDLQSGRQLDVVRHLDAEVRARRPEPHTLAAGCGVPHSDGRDVRDVRLDLPEGDRGRGELDPAAGDNGAREGTEVAHGLR